MPIGKDSREELPDPIMLKLREAIVACYWESGMANAYHSDDELESPYLAMQESGVEKDEHAGTHNRNGKRFRPHDFSYSHEEFSRRLYARLQALQETDLVRRHFGFDEIAESDDGVVT